MSFDPRILIGGIVEIVLSSSMCSMSNPRDRVTSVTVSIPGRGSRTSRTTWQGMSDIWIGSKINSTVFFIQIYKLIVFVLKHVLYVSEERV